LGGLFDLDKKRDEINSIQEELNSPSIWDNVNKANDLNTRLSYLKKEYDEYNELYSYIEEIMSMMLEYKNTAGGVLQSFIYDLPKNMMSAVELVEKFDKEKFQSVIDFAVAANGGRDIYTNSPIENFNVIKAVE
jgi:peptide chain release factor 2